MSEVIRGPVAVATNDPRWVEVMQGFAAQDKIRLGKKTVRRKLPASRNGYEYSDTLGGDLASGAAIERELHDLFIAHEDVDPDEGEGEGE